MRHDQRSSHLASEIPPPNTLPGQAPAAVERDDDDWLGCEALHPLTWLPAADLPACSEGAAGAPRR